MNKDVSYRSARLLLRGIRREDAAKIVHWRSDPDNYRTFFDARPITMEEHLTWFERYLVDDARYDFMIFNEDGQPIGTAGLSSITDDSCEVSYMIGEKAERGKGYATEAVRLLTDVALRELGVKRVVARVRPENEASARVVIGGGTLSQSVSSPSRRPVIFLSNNDNTEPLVAWLKQVGERVIETSDPLDVETVEEADPALVLSFNYRHIVRRDVIDAVRGRIINVHCSLLPWNRGASPNFFSFYDNTPKGVSVHELTEKLDQGRILLQREVHMSDIETFSSSYAKLIATAIDLVKVNWKDLRDGICLPYPQKGEGSYHTVAEMQALREKYPFAWSDRIDVWKERYGLE